jgi:hypothetical protein
MKTLGLAAGLVLLGACRGPDPCAGEGQGPDLLIGYEDDEGSFVELEDGDALDLQYTDAGTPILRMEVRTSGLSTYDTVTFVMDLAVGAVSGDGLIAQTEMACDPWGYGAASVTADLPDQAYVTVEGAPVYISAAAIDERDVSIEDVSLDLVLSLPE